MTDVLKSEAKKSLQAKLATQKARAATSDAEIWRLTTLIRDDVYATTAVHRMQPTKVATVGIVIGDAPTSNRTTTSEDAAEAKRRNDNLERTLKGESIVVQPDLKAQLDNEHKQRRAIEDAIEFLERQIAAENHKLAVNYCATLKTKEAEQMKRLFKALADVHAIHSEINDARQTLIDDEIGLHGVYHTMPDFLSNPRNRFSDLGDFFREGKRLGYIASVPKEFA
jgi:hypothetical protein